MSDRAFLRYGSRTPRFLSRLYNTILYFEGLYVHVRGFIHTFRRSAFLLFNLIRNDNIFSFNCNILAFFSIICAFYAHYFVVSRETIYPHCFISLPFLCFFILPTFVRLLNFCLFFGLALKVSVHNIFASPIRSSWKCRQPFTLTVSRCTRFIIDISCVPLRLEDLFYLNEENYLHASICYLTIQVFLSRRSRQPQVIFTYLTRRQRQKHLR